MTEEIIINGVNVAGCHNKTPYKNDYGDVQCKCYRFEDIENDTFLLGICKQHPNCYYKQLQSLKQENEELRNENEELHIKYAGCNTANNAIQEENRELQNALKSIKSILDTKCSIVSNAECVGIINEVLK